MGHLYKFLGLTVGCIQQQQPPEERRIAYGSDITYGTASKSRFRLPARQRHVADFRVADQVQQRPLLLHCGRSWTSILVDEARTPLIISGPSADDALRARTWRSGRASNISFSQQMRSVNRLAQEAKDEAWTSFSTGDQAVCDPQVAPGQNGMLETPAAWAEMMEDGAIRKALDKFDLEMSGDFVRAERHAKLKEELYSPWTSGSGLPT